MPHLDPSGILSSPSFLRHFKPEGLEVPLLCYSHPQTELVVPGCQLVDICSLGKERVQKFMLGKLVDFSIKWVGGVPLVH